MLAPPPLPRTLAASYRDLESERPAVRASAIEDLARHARRDEEVRGEALARLVGMLTDADPKPRAAAAVVLGELGGAGEVTALLGRVDDDDAYVRQMVVNALGELGDERALPRLRTALGDERPEMRYQAIIALTRVSSDDEEIARALVGATNDDDDAVVHIALRLAEERVDAGRSLDARLVMRAKALLDAPPPLALVAAILLGKAGESAGNSVLVRVVAGERLPGAGRAPEKEDEQAAVELVGALGLDAARPHLEKRAWGLARHVKDTCAFHAVIALARMRHPRAVAQILEGLASRRSEVVASSVVSAGRAKLHEARPRIAALGEGDAPPDLVEAALAALDGEGDKTGEGDERA